MILGTIRGSVINDLIHGFRRTPKRIIKRLSIRSLAYSLAVIITACFIRGSTGENDFSLDEPLSFRMIFRLDIYFPCCFIGFLRKFCEDKSKRPKHPMTGGEG